MADKSKRGRKRVVKEVRAVEEVSVPSFSGEVVQVVAEKLGSVLERLEKIEQDLVQMRHKRLDNASSSAGSTTNSFGGVLSDPGISNNSMLSANLNTVVGPSVGTGGVGASPAVYVGKPFMEKPRFSGRENDLSAPVKFLENLRRYIIAINGTDRALQVAVSCLQEPALSVLDIYRCRWVSLEQFELDFLAVYWNERVQRKLKDKLIQDTWSTSLNLSYEEYFASQVNCAKRLTIPFSERELIDVVLRGLPINIQQLWFSSNRNDISIFSAVEFLRNIEQNVKERGPSKITNGPHVGNVIENSPVIARNVASSSGNNTQNSRFSNVSRGRANRNVASRAPLVREFRVNTITRSGTTPRGNRRPLMNRRRSLSGNSQVAGSSNSVRSDNDVRNTAPAIKWVAGSDNVSARGAPSDMTKNSQ